MESEAGSTGTAAPNQLLQTVTVTLNLCKPQISSTRTTDIPHAQYTFFVLKNKPQEFNFLLFPGSSPDYDPIKKADIGKNLMCFYYSAGGNYSVILRTLH